MASSLPRRWRSAPAIALILGALAIGVAMLAGRSDLLTALLEPPAPVGWLLGMAAAVLGVWLLLRSSEQVGSSREPVQLVRAIRLVFLAVAAFAAAGGWFVGSAVPIVAGLVIAGVDVLETTFFLMVTARR
jgi:cadmium resistance protein CadD (predicted permease)